MDEFTKVVELRGHILDSLTLPKVLDAIQEHGAGYETEEIRTQAVRKRRQSSSDCSLGTGPVAFTGVVWGAGSVFAWEAGSSACAGRSRTTVEGSLSSRTPLNEAWRTSPSTDGKMDVTMPIHSGVPCVSAVHLAELPCMSATKESLPAHVEVNGVASFLVFASPGRMAFERSLGSMSIVVRILCLWIT